MTRPRNTTTAAPAAAALLCALLLSCGLGVEETAGQTEGACADGACTAAATAGSSSTTSTSTSTSATAGVSVTDESAGSGGGETTGCEFICDSDFPLCDEIPGLDGHARCSLCDVWSQDCHDGEKCVPYDSTGNNSWDSVKCVPVADDAGAAGEPCTSEGVLSAVDTCAEGHVCYYLNEDNEGVCVPQCIGSPEDPSCPNPGDVCTIFNDGVLTLCRPTCDPLLQDCDVPVEVVCAPVSGLFACIIDGSGAAGAYLDPCQSFNGCDPGNACLIADVVPGCQGEDGCCSPFCDITEMPSPCPDGTECVPWYQDGRAPPQYTNVGFCGAPPP